MIQALLQLLEPVSRRIALLISRGVVRLSDDSSGGNQRLQVTVGANETREKLERVQNYGLASRPLSGSEAVVLFPNGSRDFGLVIAVDDRRYRLKPLEEGEVALYTDEGDKIHIQRGGTIVIQAASKVQVTAPSVELGEGTLESALNGQSFQALFNAHTHTTTSPGNPTSPPIVPSTAAQLSTKVKSAT